MKKYFYSDEKEKKGPFSFEELKNKEINSDTLIWFEGLTDWTAAKYILELEEILQLSPPPITITDTIKSSESNSELTDIDNTRIQSSKKPKVENYWEIESINNNYPWRRFFARTVDLFTSGFLLIMLFSYVFGMTFPNSVDSYIKFIENPLGASIAVYLLWIPTEAFFLFFIGTTPAKWLFGIHVKGRDGENLSFPQSLFRAFQVFVSGEGFAIPIITLVSRISCYRSLRANGKMSWDSSVGSEIYYEKLSTIKIIASVIVTLSILVLLAYLYSEL